MDDKRRERLLYFSLEIVRRICMATKTSPTHVLVSYRAGKYRQLAYYMTREFTDATLQEVGDVFDREEATVSAGIAKVRESLKRRRGELWRVFLEVLNTHEDEIFQDQDYATTPLAS